jgi:thiamine monophosphate kinase
MAVGGQIVEHPAKTEQIAAAGLVGQRRLLFAQMAEPGEEMGIAAELGESAYLGESSVEPGEESAGNAAIVSHAVAAQSQGESTEVRFKDLVEVSPWTSS